MDANKLFVATSPTNPRKVDANKVYLSECMQRRYFDIYEQLCSVLDANGINHAVLANTSEKNDLWCRDYMPIQVNEKKFVRFRYEPSYLTEDPNWKNECTDPSEICEANGIETIYSNINLDGGNVLMGKDHVLISDRIFDENPEYQDENELVAEIECLLEAKVIIIPQINRDFTGHADGMVRWYNEDTILGNCREDEYKYWSKGIDRVLKKYDLHYIDVPFFEPPKNKRYSAIGVYVNFLEVQDLIVLPVFGVEGNHDDDVVRLFQDHFPNRKITTIDYNEIAKEGGLLNCTTWTVKE